MRKEPSFWRYLRDPCLLFLYFWKVCRCETYVNCWKEEVCTDDDNLAPSCSCVFPRFLLSIFANPFPFPQVVFCLFGERRNPPVLVSVSCERNRETRAKLHYARKTCGEGETHNEVSGLNFNWVFVIVEGCVTKLFNSTWVDRRGKWCSSPIGNVASSLAVFCSFFWERCVSLPLGVGFFIFPRETKQEPLVHHEKKSENQNIPPHLLLYPPLVNDLCVLLLLSGSAVSPWFLVF